MEIKLLILKNNIHLMGYSIPVDDKVVPYNELMNKLYTISDMPNVIPYITSYYLKIGAFVLLKTRKKY